MSTTTPRHGVTWLKPSIVAILSVFAVLLSTLIAASPADAPTARFASAAAGDTGAMALSMSVDPGDPVPMRIVTEKSAGEL